jgi:Phage integrase family
MDLVRTEARSRSVADAFGTPVLRDHGQDRLAAAGSPADNRGCGNDAGRGVGDAGTTSRGWVSTRGRRPSRFARRTTSRRRGRGRRFTFHALRHTAATLLPSEGEHPKMVQELLGHAQVSLTLDRYSHMTPRLMSNAAASWTGCWTRRRDLSAAVAVGMAVGAITSAGLVPRMPAGGVWVLVGPPVFKTGVSSDPAQAGSIPVRLR